MRVSLPRMPRRPEPKGETTSSPISAHATAADTRQK